MDGYTGKSRGLPPFAGGVQTVSFRGNGTLLLREILSKWVGKAGGHHQLALVASIAPVQSVCKLDRKIKKGD